MKHWSELIECPDCEGRGQYVADHFEFGNRYEECDACGGTGRMSPFKLINYWYYMYLEETIMSIYWKLRGEK